LNANDFPHDPTMPGQLAVRLLTMFRICGFLCRFRADEGSYREFCSPFFCPRSPHEIMITDEY
jgi:hypothetical protein